MSRPVRAMARSLAPFIVTALRKDAPIPARSLAINILKIDIDAMLTTQARYFNEVKKQKDNITDFMRSQGYEVVESKNVLEWIRENTKKREDEDTIQYLDRVSMFLARVLAVGGIIVMDMTDVYQQLSPFTGITTGEQV